MARLNVDVADARVDQLRADLLPQVSGFADYSRQTLNLDEFGIPIAALRTQGEGIPIAKQEQLFTPKAAVE